MLYVDHMRSFRITKGPEVEEMSQVEVVASVCQAMLVMQSRGSYFGFLLSRHKRSPEPSHL